MELGMTLEDYLESIYLLGAGKNPVRLTDIARKLGVRKSTVVSALKRLQQEGLVLHERYGDVILTQRGIEIAAEVYEKHLSVYAFLSEILGIDDIIANREACRIEHYISDNTARRMKKLVEFARSCEKIKRLFEEDFERFVESGELPRFCEEKEVNSMSLDAFKPGEIGIVKKINCELSVKSRLLAMGVVPGAEVRVEKVAPLGDPVEIIVKGYHLSLRKEEAKCIEVEKI